MRTASVLNMYKKHFIIIIAVVDRARVCVAG